MRVTSATSTAVEMLLPLALIDTSSGLSLKAVSTAITYAITGFFPIYTVFFFIVFIPRVSKFVKVEGGQTNYSPTTFKDRVNVEDLKYSKKRGFYGLFFFV